MIRWVEIVSPHLRVLHQDWMAVRGSRLLPNIHGYNAFAETPASQSHAAHSALITVPPGRDILVVRYRGDDVKLELLDGADASTALRVGSAMSSALGQICKTRQPDCRRTENLASPRRERYERLLLPFDDDRLRVCLIYVVFEMAGERERMT